MSETWKRWAGRTVDGRFPLQSYLGGSDHSAVFLTLTQGGAGDSEKAAIKLIPADAADAEKQLLQWKSARDLNHPNLIRIFEAGRCELDDTALLYVVEEYAEENLSQILPERALTAEETRGMLPPILRALQYVHDKGLVHGRIRPSNILAIGDQVKLSSDSLGGPGERRSATTSAYDPPEAATGAMLTAVDVWQLGMTLIEVLTQRLPVWDRTRPSAPEVPAVPEPFREVAGHCLQVDAEKRWTVGQILERLGAERQGSEKVESARPVPMSAQTEAQTEKMASAPAIPGQHKESAKWPYWLLIAASIVVALVLIVRTNSIGIWSTRREPANPPAEVQSTQAQQGGGDEKASTNADTTNADNQGGVVQRVVPQVSPSARRTIQGRIKVRVKVEVDAAGNVAKATLESERPSKYFSRLALESARGWKFSPVQAGESGAREWKLQFAFSRAKTDVSAVRAKR